MKRKRKLRFTQCETKTCDMELGGKEEGEKLLKEVKVMSFSTMSNVHNITCVFVGVKIIFVFSKELEAL